MKKKAVMLLLGSTVMSAVMGGSVQAKTYAWDAGKGIFYYYVTDGEEESTEDFTEDFANAEAAEESSEDFITAEAAEGSTGDSALAEAEEEENESFRSAEAAEAEAGDDLEAGYTAAMQNELAEYEAYGVSYDADKDEIRYMGKTVRWLIDKIEDGTYRAIQMPDGEIDLYTTRTDGHKLDGVRVATQAEYDERTQIDKDAVLVENAESTYVIGIEDEAGSVLWTTVGGMQVEEDGSITYTFSDGSTISSVRPEENGETVEVYEGSVGCISEATPAESLPEADMAENDEKVREYKAAGIGYDDESGCWLLGDDAVYWLMDEDGSMYTNGSEEAKANRIYVIVKRNEDGSIKEVKMATIEDVMEAKINKDMAETEQ